MSRRWGLRFAFRFACLALSCFALPAGAETGWVDDEVRLNLRTGPLT